MRLKKSRDQRSITQTELLQEHAGNDPRSRQDGSARQHEEPSDVAAALDSGAEGVGLFRTEFIFLGRGDMPSEDEQFEAYRTAVKAMQGRPITIRTFDLGNDKNLHSDDIIGGRRRDNPALGLRSIRLSLAEPASFQAQLRAILRVSKLGKVKILIPMMSHAHQIDQTLAALEQAKSSLHGGRE